MHYTELYNALLNSIGIKALYASGEAINNIETLNRENHAWTVAEIDGKWIGLDATWNIFSGKLPQCHLYRKFEGTFDPIGFFIPGSESNNKISTFEELKLIEIVNYTQNKNTENTEDISDSQNNLEINILFLLIILLIQF